MAELKPALARVLKSEGGHGNDPVDPGRETYCGVSRRYHPAWSGWVIIDEWKAKPGFPENLKSDHALELAVETFYRAIWKRLHCEEIVSQAIANELFDAAVNPGEKLAVCFLQYALNDLNKNGKLWPDIPVDGQVGPKTLAALKAAEADSEMVAAFLSVDCFNYFRGRMRKDKEKEKYARGWWKRRKLKQEDE